MTIDWELTVTNSDHWLGTDSDCHWPLTGHWQWLQMTIDWALIVTGSDDWLHIDSDWHWPVKSGSINQEHSNWYCKEGNVPKPPVGRINAAPNTQLQETDLENLTVGWECLAAAWRKLSEILPAKSNSASVHRGTFYRRLQIPIQSYTHAHTHTQMWLWIHVSSCSDHRHLVFHACWHKYHN